MSEFNDSTSVWTKAKEKFDNSIDRVMQRDWRDASKGASNLSTVPSSLQASLTIYHAPAWSLTC